MLLSVGVENPLDHKTTGKQHELFLEVVLKEPGSQMEKASIYQEEFKTISASPYNAWSPSRTERMKIDRVFLIHSFRNFTEQHPRHELPLPDAVNLPMTNTLLGN